MKKMSAKKRKKRKKSAQQLNLGGIKVFHLKHKRNAPVNSSS